MLAYTCSAPQAGSGSLELSVLEKYIYIKEIPSKQEYGCYIPHVRRRFDARDILQHDVAETDEADEATGSVLPPVVSERDGSEEKVEDSTTEEGRHERRISGDVDEQLCWCLWTVVRQCSLTDRPTGRY